MPRPLPAVEPENEGVVRQRRSGRLLRADAGSEATRIDTVGADEDGIGSRAARDGVGRDLAGNCGDESRRCKRDGILAPVAVGLGLSAPALLFLGEGRVDLEGVRNAVFPGECGRRGPAKRIALVYEIDWAMIAPGATITLSAGVASIRPGMTRRALLSEADVRLYEAKYSGRNRVIPHKLSDRDR